MWKNVYLVLLGALGVFISLFAFNKKSVNLGDVQGYFQGEKTFYQVFVEPDKSPMKLPAKALPHTQLVDYKYAINPCGKLISATDFVRRYLREFIDLKGSFTEEFKKVTLLKDYKHTITSTYFLDSYINHYGEEAKRLSIRGDFSQESPSCPDRLKEFSDIVYKIASASTRNEIKDLTGFVYGDGAFENENIIVSHPFVFYFDNQQMLDFKYKTTHESNYAKHYLGDEHWFSEISG